MLPSVLARDVRTGLQDQLKASFAPTTKSFDRLIDDFVDAPDMLIKGPWLTLELPFRRTKSRTEFYPYLPLGFRAYSHQEKAFRRLSGDRPRSSIVATGTGSGKTECFLYPILDACIRSKRQAGIKAIIIYPMNALAADQARRIAGLVAKTPALSGVRVGIYADERPDHPTDEMTQTDVINSREALVRDPPDVLLTNYKMLDYMLLRPDERDIWTRNRPETLRYLVVDELHTFDGAQGTDLASLIRRLKSRLGVARGHLCCVGTSATLGGPESVPDLLDYARRVFDEDFDDDAIVVEDRQSVAEYLEGVDVEHADFPSASYVRGLAEGSSEIGRKRLVSESFSAWFGQPEPEDVDEPHWRLELGDQLNRHTFLHRLLHVTQGRPTSIDDLRAELARTPVFREWSERDIDCLLDTFTALVAHARRADSPDSTALRPFLNVRSQLWVRELRRMVATVSKFPRLLHYNDLGEGEQNSVLPVVHCRSCGGAGWATQQPNDERRSMRADPADIYKTYFGFSDRLRFIFREAPSIRKSGGGGLNSIPGLICDTCLVFLPREGETTGECPSCKKKDGAFHVHVVKPGRFVDGRFRIDHDCPFCGSPSGMGILGAQSVTLVAGMVGTLFGSEFNDDPKLLAFSDSVQDAAHRAAVLQARNATNVFRAGLSRFVCEAVEPPDLKTAMDRAPAAMKAGQDDDAGFVSTYIPADMQWRRDYERLLAEDALPEGSRLADYLKERLSWETFSELTFRGRLGATLERSGVAIAHVDAEKVLVVANALVARLADEVGNVWKDVGVADLRLFLFGMLDHMRSQGAVATPVTRMYVQREAKWYAVYKGFGGVKSSLPNYAPAAPKPVFPSNVLRAGFETYATDSAGAWYRAWFYRCFDHLGVLGADCEDFYRKVFDLLEANGIVERLSIGTTSKNAIAAWGLTPTNVRVFSGTSLVRCSACGNSHRVPQKYAALWGGMPCTRVGCGGVMSDAPEPDGAQTRARLLTKGRIKRVVAAEHTSLLDREQRKSVERRFMQDGAKPWYPNLLSATPTLEMGINIGDLSTLILCSVPPEQANYVQRIGRAGRRDGNALNVTVAMARPHDMWFWADPAEMISGQVKTPGVHLGAVAILRRQFAAFTLDCWVAEHGANVAGYGRVGEALKTIRSGTRNRFPLFWFDFIKGNATRLFEDFVRLFPELSDSESLANLHAFAHGGEIDGLAHLVAQEYRDVEMEITSIGKRIDANKSALEKLINTIPREQDFEDRKRDLEREKQALRMIRDEIQKGDNLAFLTDRGILPNYAFPEAGVTLKSILFRAEAEGEEGRRPAVTEYIRSAASALSEFAPGANFYVQGRKLKIDHIDLNASPIEYWRICPDCIHIERDETEATDSHCPVCGSEMWEDRGSRTPMVHLRQVLATGTDRSTRIPEDGDDRERTPMDRDYLPAIERDQIAQAYAIDEDETPFAYEFLRRCTFREVNFGEGSDAPTGQKVAGERRSGHGFRICQSCGRVQDPFQIGRIKDENLRKKGLHAPRCKEAAKATEETFASVVYVYREFSSEAMRLLLPFASDRQGAEVTSLRSAIDLGLRLHFKGKVSHLRSTLVEAKEGPLTRRYLFLYDSVPGGTGYLKQLASSTDDMRDVFLRARDHMVDCVCNKDPRKDGCPRCIRSHSATFGRGEISRNSAVRQINQILAGWSKLHPVATVSDIKLNKALESELEQMFVERLRREVKEGGGAFTKIVVAGKPGYAIRIGDQAWTLEPQCWLQEQFPNMPPTRADMVLWPAVPMPGIKPVAVYLDGWQFHAHSVPDDLALRQKIVRSGKLLVWSATWDDVATPPDNGKPKHYWEPQPVLHPNIPEVMADGETRAMDAQSYVDKAPFDQWLAFLAEPEVWKWQTRAVTFAMSWFMQGLTKDRANVATMVEELAGGEARKTFADTEVETFCAKLADLNNGVIAVAIPKTMLNTPRPLAWPEAQDVTVVLGFEHRAAKSEGAKKSWNGALRLLNLLQFLPFFYVGCPDSIAPDAALRIRVVSEPDVWSDVEDVVLGDLLPLVRELRRRGAPAPEALYEAAGSDGGVFGTFEIAWPDKRIGIVLDKALASAFPGWTVRVFDRDPGLIDAVLGMLI
jgi:DEAD/DEAH box helicase domain-containing protein